MTKRILISLILPLALLGCKESGLSLKIRFDQIQGLKEGDRVIFEQSDIGHVTAVSYPADGYYMVDLAIKSSFAGAATENSKFFVVEDAQNKGHKAVEVIQTPRGGAPLQDGTIVEGSSKSSTLFTQASEDFEKQLENLRKNFEQFLEDLSSVGQSEEFKKLEKELERLAEEMRRLEKSAREKIQKELLPQLKEELEKLRKRLRKFGREEELKPLETQMEKIEAIGRWGRP